MAILSTYLARLPSTLHLNDAAEMFVNELLIEHTSVARPVPGENAL